MITIFKTLFPFYGDFVCLLVSISTERFRDLRITLVIILFLKNLTTRKLLDMWQFLTCSPQYIALNNCVITANNGLQMTEER